MTVEWLIGELHDSPEAGQWWAELTGAHLDASGALIPPQGSPALAWSPGAGLSLGVVVAEVGTATDAALAAGAVRAGSDGGPELTSPGGLPWSLATWKGDAPQRATPVSWAGGHHSMVYQVCIDVPPRVWDVERAFWQAVLDADFEVLTARPEFGWLRGGRQLGLDVLLQRLDDDAPAVGMHLDFGTNDRAAEVARHRALGAVKLLDEQFWALMQDPWGRRYCVTDRDPKSGRLSSRIGS